MFTKRIIWNDKGRSAPWPFAFSGGGRQHEAAFSRAAEAQNPLWSSTDWKQMWQLPHKAPARPPFLLTAHLKWGEPRVQKTERQNKRASFNMLHKNITWLGKCKSRSLTF